MPVPVPRPISDNSILLAFGVITGGGGIDTDAGN